MNFDNTQIVIRERGYLELLDLALRVLRTQAAPLFVALLAGIGPFVLLNAWLLDRIAAVPADTGPPWKFLVLMFAAVLWELPLATGPATMCLGRALFNQPLPARNIAREFVQSLPQLILYQVVLRGLLLASVAGCAVPLIANPYLNEVILLERNPIQAVGNKSISTGRRSSMLNRGQGGDFFTRWILNIVDRPDPARRVWGSLAVAAQVLFNEQVQSGPFLYLPISGRPLGGGRVFYRRAIPQLSRPSCPPRRLGRGTADAGRTGPLDPNAASELNSMSKYEDPQQAIDAGGQALRQQNRFPWYDSAKDSLRRVEVRSPEKATFSAPVRHGIF